MYVQFVEKAPVHDGYGKPILTNTDSSNPWWVLLKDAIEKAGGKLHEPEIFAASTDCRYFRRGQRFPAFGFSPMVNTPILLHDHNEVYLFSSFIFCLFLINHHTCVTLIIHSSISFMTYMSVAGLHV